MSILQLDNNLTLTLFHWGSRNSIWEWVSFVASTVFVYGVPIVLVVMFFKGAKERLVSTKLLLLVLISWRVVSSYVGTFFYTQFAFRDRPFSLSGKPEFFFEQPTKAFPSDHATLLAAITLGFFAYRYPKLGRLFLVGTVITSVGRVLIGFHYVGDILAGWLLGAATFGLFILFDKPVTVLIKKLYKLVRWPIDGVESLPAKPSQ